MFESSHKHLFPVPVPLVREKAWERYLPAQPILMAHTGFREQNLPGLEEQSPSSALCCLLLCSSDFHNLCPVLFVQHLVVFSPGLLIQEPLQSISVSQLVSSLQPVQWGLFCFS